MYLVNHDRLPVSQEERVNIVVFFEPGDRPDLQVQLKFDYLQHADWDSFRGPDAAAEGIRLAPNLLLLDERSPEISRFHSPILAFLDFVDDLSELVLGRLLAAQGAKEGRQLLDQFLVVHEVFWNHAAAGGG